MFNYIIYTMVDIYVNLKLFLLTSVQTLYANYPVFDRIDQGIRHNVDHGYKWWFHIRSEPTYENWINLSTYTIVDRRDAGNAPQITQYHEMYLTMQEFNENIHLFRYFERIMKNRTTTLQAIKKEHHSVYNDTMLIVKNDDRYMIHVHRTSPNPNKYCYMSDVQDITWKPSKVRFLSVIYSHPQMSLEIPLEIPSNMFFVGNHLLSSTFVLRMLEYTIGTHTMCNQNVQVTFDKNYKLKIMDSNIKYFEMISDEYLELDESSYTHARISSDT